MEREIICLTFVRGFNNHITHVMNCARKSRPPIILAKHAAAIANLFRATF
jgi:hypothetical protein